MSKTLVDAIYAVEASFFNLLVVLDIAFAFMTNVLIKNPVYQTSAPPNNLQ